MKIDKADATEIAKNAVLDKYQETVIEWGRLGEELDALEKRREELIARRAKLEALGPDFASAARILGFDLMPEFQKRLAIFRPGGTPAPEMPSASLPLPAKREEKISIKKFVQKAAEAAYPRPVRAATIRADLARLGEDVHEKTVGMTLYRLLKKGLLRREGFDWYFVPGHERPAQEEGADA